MASFLLGDEYASSSEEESSPRARPVTKESAPVAAAPSTELLPSADELFASDTSSRKNEQTSRPATKAVKTETGEAARKPKIAPFAPPQLRCPNISTEDRSSWNTDKTLALQRKAKEAEARDK
ncbi:hypothetical protein PHYSODRAFT_490402 [Phytophthora sojae]|uniref:Uncharacterized protein n=1 Tax=Phytophthora sojae (strain P6497) TaxID=1094619 RepID=G4Z816_PHYSP|nr:hypothetical protein PHYSODRAFT_490402 [Phytophthora sojae]EGZ19671.1 hypothetical protein PHYSODRAFT_490402 [Phytophthora sojae]|eukprot:XP_009522388.1 hypothetical protein PHYSODRAFT_490402 [Phytophthora sojae]